MTRDPEQPLTPFQWMLEQEMRQAAEELRRPAYGLLLSAVSAGFGVGISFFLIAAIATLGENALSTVARQLLIANAYAVGFIIVILGRMDLFTEFTTIAILPILSRRAPVRSLARLWGLVYVGNLAGAAVFALLAVMLGPELGVMALNIVTERAIAKVDHAWWVILLSGLLAGWLMGVLSWLIVGGRDTISQVFFIWIIALSIGLGHLHHSIVGAVEVFAGVMAAESLTTTHLGHFLLWATLGNALGGFLFAASVRYSLHMRQRGDADSGQGQG